MHFQGYFYDVDGSLARLLWYETKESLIRIRFLSPLAFGNSRCEPKATKNTSLCHVTLNYDRRSPQHRHRRRSSYPISWPVCGGGECFLHRCSSHDGTLTRPGFIDHCLNSNGPRMRRYTHHAGGCLAARRPPPPSFLDQPASHPRSDVHAAAATPPPPPLVYSLLPGSKNVSR